MSLVISLVTIYILDTRANVFVEDPKEPFNSDQVQMSGFYFEDTNQSSISVQSKHKYL